MGTMDAIQRKVKTLRLGLEAHRNDERKYKQLYDRCLLYDYENARNHLAEAQRREVKLRHALEHTATIYDGLSLSLTDMHAKLKINDMKVFDFRNDTIDLQMKIKDAERRRAAALTSHGNQLISAQQIVEDRYASQMQQLSTALEAERRQSKTLPKVEDIEEGRRTLQKQLVAAQAKRRRLDEDLGIAQQQKESLETTLSCICEGAVVAEQTFAAKMSHLKENIESSIKRLDDRDGMERLSSRVSPNDIRDTSVSHQTHPCPLRFYGKRKRSMS